MIFQTEPGFELLPGLPALEMPAQSGKIEHYGK
jgi:hypothetical protein